MGREEMVRLAKESGVWDQVGFPKCVIKLIELVAAHEREACAQLCEDLWKDDATAWDCAVAIEARGEVVEVA